MKKVSRIEYCASFEPLQSGMGQDGESKILFPTMKSLDADPVSQRNGETFIALLLCNKGLFFIEKPSLHKKYSGHMLRQRRQK